MTKQVTKQMPCRGCGEPITVGIRTRIQPRCIQCGVQESAIAMRQMSEKSGPYYDRWLAGMALFAQRIARGTEGGSGSPPVSAEN